MSAERERSAKSEKFKPGSVFWKKPGAGFLGVPCWVVVITPEEPGMPCMLHDIDDDRECLEVATTAWTLPGETRAEALDALSREEYLGAAYHLSECELFEEIPNPPPPETGQCQTCGVPIALSGWVRIPYCAGCDARRKSKNSQDAAEANTYT